MRGSSFGRDVFSFCCGFEAVVNININVIFSGYFRTDVLRKKVRVNKSSVHPCYVMKYEGKTKKTMFWFSGWRQNAAAGYKARKMCVH